MNSGKTVFAQLMDFLPAYEFHQCVERYRGITRSRASPAGTSIFAWPLPSSRYRESLRDIEACLRAARTEALPHGDTREGIPQYAGQRQSGQGLAYLRGFRPGPHRTGPEALCPRLLWDRLGPHRLCARFDDDRPLPVPLSLGGVQKTQRRGQASHASRPPGEHPHSNRHYPWEGSRCEHPRPDQYRTRRILHHGPGISRLCPPSQNPRIRSLLCHPGKDATSGSSGSILRA